MTSVEKKEGEPVVKRLGDWSAGSLESFTATKTDTYSARKHQEASIWLAYLVVGVYLLSALLSLAGVGWFAARSFPWDGEVVVSKQITPLFQSAAIFISAVFGTPMGFIFGYFFKTKSEGRLDP